MEIKPQQWIVIRQFYGAADGTLVQNPETFDSEEAALAVAEKLGGQAASLVTVDEQQVRLRSAMTGQKGDAFIGEGGKINTACAACGMGLSLGPHKLAIQPSIVCPCGAHYLATVVL